jgi:hypothetical protein
LSAHFSLPSHPTLYIPSHPLPLQVIAKRAGREEVTTTIARLQSSIASVKEEMAAQQAESERARLELERSARLTAEGNAAMLRWVAVGGRSGGR